MKKTLLSRLWMRNLLRLAAFSCVAVFVCCSANGELPVKGRGKMTQTYRIEEKNTVWYGKKAYSPELPGGTGLFFNAVEAVSPSGPTVALAAAYRLGSPYIEYYGGQLPRPIRVVAVNEESGLVYEADLKEPDHPPVRILITDKVAKEIKPSGMIESAHFNVDLAALLRLPEQEGRYKVFLWLDELVSRVVAINIPANPARGKGKPVASVPIRVVHFGPDPASPGVEPGKLELALGGKPEETAVHGSWIVKAEKGENPVFWLLANSHRDRRFAWVALRAKDVPQDEATTTFSFNTGDLLKTSDVAQKVFIIGLAANAVSNVHVITVNAR
jgi:hypothetical protein